MSADSSVALNDQKEKSGFFPEIVNAEKQLWALIHSKGPLHPGVQDLYRKSRSSHEKIFLSNHEVSELQDAEYSMWKLHYKHIDEFRKHIRQSSANAESKKMAMPQKTAGVLNSDDNHTEGFKSFLLEATDFYLNLVMKVRKYYGLPEEPLFYKKGGIFGSIEPTKMHKCDFLCHRFLVCLGDFARYRERCEKPDIESCNWSVAATYYLEATMTWPDSGNPQNQLAVLATYIGDEFLALYHCLRSLAVKEPFPDAWDNLILLFEKNRASHLHALSSEAHFDFSRPSERITVQNKLQSSDLCSLGTDLWSLITRMISFFFIKSSLEDFNCTFASTMRDFEVLMALDDMKLNVALESYQLLDSARRGPFRALQVVSILIFVIQKLTKSTELKESGGKNDMQQPMLIQLALMATFTCMGRLVDRCLKYNPMDSCPLLPAVLVFAEWLVDMIDKAEVYGTNEKSMNAISYFFANFVHLLNQLEDNQGEEKSTHRIALWEDFELRGFAPLADAQVSLDFSTHCEHMSSFENGKGFRTQRILNAAMKIVNRSSGSQKWIVCDKLGGKFCVGESGEFPDGRGSESAESSSDPVVKETHWHILEATKDCQKLTLEENQNNPCVHGKSVAVEEEEVILFKPITRYNSAPLAAIITNDQMPPECMGDQSAPPDECLRRASSLLMAQNEGRSNPLSFCSDMANFRFNKPFKQQEPLLKDSVAQPFLEIPISAGPPSLSSWVLNKGSLSVERERVAKDDGKLGSGPVGSISSASLTGFPIIETQESVVDCGLASTANHCSSPYSAPVPSAPLLPDDAAWFTGVPSSFSECKSLDCINERDNFLNASQVSNPSNWTASQESPNSGPTIPGFMGGYSPSPGMTNPSEWFHQYKDNHNLERANSYIWPLQFYAPANLGNFPGYDASTFDLFDRWGNPVASNSMIYLENPPLHPGFPLPYGVDEQRRDRFFQNYQRSSPYVCGAVTDLRGEQQPLLHYMKEKEWRMQRDPQVRGPTYMGS